jgi:ABC-type transport system involved in multi-copper enzyme maturation permease subunit
VKSDEESSPIFDFNFGDILMISHIMRKEILENLLSLRFIISLLLIVLLFAVSSFVFVGKYKQQSQDYWNRTNKNLSGLSEQTGKLYEVALYMQSVWTKPKPLSFCAEGFEKYFPNHFKFNVFEMDYPKVKNRTNAMLSHFCDLDWSFIISLFLSFIALVFTYDSICGEKQAGTLRLMLAGSTLRHRILLGKYFGAMFTLGIPLLIGLLLHLIILIASNIVVIGLSEGMRIIAIVLLSFLYLSIFVLLGLFVSSRTSRTASCMVILLFVWVGLVILMPSFGRIFSDTFQKVSTKAERERTKSEALKQIWDNAYAEKYGKNAINRDLDLNSPENNPPARARFANASWEAEGKILEEHLNQMMAQAVIGRRFTRFVPTTIYQNASEAVAGTGLNRFLELYQQIRRYQEDLKEFIRSKDAEDPDSLHLLCPEELTIQYWKTISHNLILCRSFRSGTFLSENPCNWQSGISAYWHYSTWSSSQPRSCHFCDTTYDS